MEKLEKIHELPAERIEVLKKQHGDVFTLEVPFTKADGTEVILCAYLKRPDRVSLGFALGVIDTNPLKAKEIILENGWIEGDERIKTDDEAFLSAAMALDKLIEVKISTLKKN